VRTSDFVLPDMRGGPSGAGGPGSDVQYTGAFVLPPTRGMYELRNRCIFMYTHTYTTHTYIVCIHVCIHVYVHVYICTYVDDIYYTGAFVLPPHPWDEHVYICIYIYIYTHMCIYACIYMHVCIHVNIYTQIDDMKYAGAFVLPPSCNITCIDIHIYICIYTCVYIYVYIHMYTHTHTYVRV